MNPANKISILPYSQKYQADVLEVFRSNVPTYFAQAEEPGLVYYLNHEIEWYFVVLVDGQVKACGGCNTESTGKIGIISWGMVHAANHGVGIGTILLNHRIKCLRENTSVEHIIVRTAQHTFKFYEKHGFVLSAIKKDYWHEGLDLYEMVLRA